MTTAILTALLTPALASGRGKGGQGLGSSGPEMCMCIGAKLECSDITEGEQCMMFETPGTCKWDCDGDEPKLGGSPVGPQAGGDSGGYGNRWIPGTHAGRCFFGMCLWGLRCENLLGGSGSRCVRYNPGQGGQGEPCRDFGRACDSGLECMYHRGQRTCQYRLYGSDSQNLGSGDSQNLGSGGDPFNGDSDLLGSGGDPFNAPEGPKLGGHGVGPHRPDHGGHPVGPGPHGPIRPTPGGNYDGFLGYQCIDGYYCNQGLRCDSGHYPYYQSQCVYAHPSHCTYPRDNGRLGCHCHQSQTCDNGYWCVGRQNGGQGVCDYPNYGPGPIRPTPTYGSSADGVTRRLDFAFEN